MSVIELNDENFQKEVLDSKGTIIVDFFAEWCGPCKMMAPIYDEASKEAGEKARFGKVNVDANQKTAQKHGIMSIPTIIIFKDGKEVEKLMGVQDKETLLSKIK